MTGDGILLQGKRLFVVQNTMNQIAVIRVDRRLREGTIKRVIKDSLFDVPTTIDDVGHNTLYAVNARFGVPPADRPTAAYNLVRVDVGHKGHGHKDKKNRR